MTWNRTEACHSYWTMERGAWESRRSEDYWGLTRDHEAPPRQKNQLTTWHVRLKGMEQAGWRPDPSQRQALSLVRPTVPLSRQRKGNLRCEIRRSA
jgi:hypothetical protein